MTLVRIYQPTKTAMQSGRAKTCKWRLVFEEAAPKYVEPLMGWVGQRDTTQQLEMLFPSKEEAVYYAEKHGLEYKIIKPKTRAIKPKSYAENFSWHKVSG